MVAQSIAEQERSVSAPVTPRWGGCVAPQRDCRQRRAEGGAGHGSAERWHNRTRRSEGPVAGFATRPEGLRACCDAFYRSAVGGQVHAGSVSLGAFANALALRNPGVRLPGAKPDEGTSCPVWGGVAGNEPPQTGSRPPPTPRAWGAVGVRWGRRKAEGGVGKRIRHAYKASPKGIGS